MGDVPRVDQWHACYKDSWGGLIASASYCHPAKFAKSLIFRIVQHAVDEGFLTPGQTALDCFAGVALGALPLLLHGIHYIGVELEPRFHDLAQANAALWQQQYGHRPGYGHATVLQGDSRALAQVLAQASAAMCVASPPYADGCRQQGHDYHSERMVGTRTGYLQSDGDGYGHTPGNLGNLPTGEVSTVISSPPYADRCANDNQRTLARDGLHQGDNEGDGATYGHTPGNLGNLPAGDVNAVISSPPYAGSLSTERSGIDWDKNTACQGRRSGPHTPGKATMPANYGANPDNLGNMAPGQVEAVVSSPPYMASVHHGNGIDQSKLTGNHPGPHTQALAEGYGNTDGQLGQSQGTTFWEAARQVVQGVYEVLTPTGVAIWVVKAYCRNGQIVDFPGAWRRLCEAVGFATLHEHHAMLTEDHGTQASLFGADTVHRTARKSFFRRLHEQKRPDLAIDYEVVFCMRKRPVGAPLPLDAVGQRLLLSHCLPPGTTSGPQQRTETQA